MKLRPTDFIQIQGWMRELQLTDKQEKLYALIWNVSMNGRGLFKGTAPYIAEWLGCTDRNVKKIIRQLEDMGLIAHEVIRTMKKTYTVFWAILPEDAAKTPKRGRIDWRGRELQFPTERVPQFPTGRELQFPTDKVSIYSRDRYKKISGGGKNSAPGRASTTTTTTGFLFEDIELPFRGEKFVEVFDDAWAKLRRQPKWAGKTPEALQIVLERLAYTNDPLQAAWCCLKAVEKGWDTIKDPFQMYTDDADEADAFFELQKELAK